MKTTREIQTASYLGADLTDRYSEARRPIDVCGLRCSPNGHLSASFWQWEWPESGNNLHLNDILEEVRTAKSTMLDGPQGLATIGQTMRNCEHLCGAVGKTPDTMPIMGRMFAGYIRSSIELFSAFHQAGVQVSPPGFTGGVSEVYPGDIWQKLANRALPRKKSPEGKLARIRILNALGVIDLPESLTDDRNADDKIDACIGAVMAAAADNQVPGISVVGLGQLLEINADGILREGPMVIPVISEDGQGTNVKQKIKAALHLIPAIVASQPQNLHLPASAGEQMGRAIALLRDFINFAREGNAKICTYKWAYTYLFGSPIGMWAQAYAQQVIRLATQTPLAELPGLGAVRLDAFVVSGSNGLPSDGHWESANYDREDWERVLGNATMLR